MQGPQGQRWSRLRIPDTALPAFLLAVLIVLLPASGQDEDRLRSDWTYGLDAAFKSSTVTSYSSDDPILHPKRWVTSELMRFRLIGTAKYQDWFKAEIAYEHRMRATTPNSGPSAGTGLLPSTADAPYRISQFDRNIGEERDSFSYRHELDRAFVAMQPEWGQVVIGRQGIGLGRGVMFSAVDVFAPFSPLEVDREWRRGVDAIRIERRLSETSSMEVIAAFGESSDASAVLGRIRGYIGDVDGEFIFGKRAEDTMFGLAASAAFMDAAVHLEAAVFKTDEDQPDGGIGSHDRLVGKLVLGASYTFDVGSGLTVIGEYHYSGFGLEDISDLNQRLLTDPDFVERYLRGDTQILGREALALQASYIFNDTWSGSLLIMGSPNDGSGVISPGMNWDYAENISIAMSLFLPWGEDSKYGMLRSEYGGSPTSLFIQLNAYF